MGNSILNHHNRESHLRIRDEMSFLERIIESDTVDQGRAISLGIILTQKGKILAETEEKIWVHSFRYSLKNQLKHGKQIKD
jgi:hypothetical protein